MRFALSVLGPALFSTLPMIGAVTALALAPAPACAQAEDDPDGPNDPNLEELEEQVLRQQIEQYLNEFARWDESKRRIVIGRAGREDELEKAKSELGGLEPIVEMLLKQMIVRGDDGRLKIKEDFKLRPFAKIVQDYIAEGGIEDIERFQRFRNGDGENPFGKGIPPRAQKAVTSLLKALNDQANGPKRTDPDRPNSGPDEGDERPSDRREARRADERKKAEAERRANEERRRAEQARRGQDEERRAEERRAEERRAARRTETPRAEPERERETRPEGRDPLMGTLRERIAKRFDMEPEEVDELLRYVREMTEEARAEMARMRDEMREHMEEFRKSDRGKELDDRMARLSRRAEDELRRFLESEETRDRLSELEKRAMDFLASEEGQQMQRKLLEFLASEDGAKIRERLGEFMASDRGRELMKRLAERFGGGRPEPKTAPRAERGPIEAERRAAAEAKRATEEKARAEAKKLEAAKEQVREQLRAMGLDEKSVEEELRRHEQGQPRRPRDGRRESGRKPTEF